MAIELRDLVVAGGLACDMLGRARLHCKIRGTVRHNTRQSGVPSRRTHGEFLVIATDSTRTARRIAAAAALMLIVNLRPSIAAADLSRTIRFDIAPQQLPAALLKYSEQSGIQVTSPAELVDGKSSAGVVGSLPARNALERLLAGTDLGYDVIDPNTVTIRAATSKVPVSAATAARGANGYMHLAQADERTSSSSEVSAKISDSSSQRDAELEEYRAGIPEILVVGSKILNMDIRRTRDDTQPYVIFERETIQRSGAVNVEDFVRNRLTMNSQKSANGQGSNVAGNTSQISLRGLGGAQTLILIDGHRTAPRNQAGGAFQGDLNGIPLAAVERIEVLPTTASGIYGGSATGGVVNIILRRDYAGLESKLAYYSTFDSGASERRADLSGGFTLEGGKTNVLFSGSFSDSNPLLVRDRDLVQQGRARVFANNPAFFDAAPTPPIGATTNIRSADGTPLFGAGTANFTSVPMGYAGGGGLAPFQATAGRYDLSFADDAAHTRGSAGSGLTNGNRVISGMATLRRQFSPRVQAFLDLNAFNNSGHFPTNQSTTAFTVAANAPNNPFGKALLATVPNSTANGEWFITSHTGRAVGGVIVKLPADWMAEADYTWSRTRQHTPDEPPRLAGVSAMTGRTMAADIQDGTLDVLRDLDLRPLDFSPYMSAGPVSTPFRATLRDTTLRFAGPLFRLPAGMMHLSALLEHREEAMGGGVLGGFFLIPPRSQTIDSASVQVTVPLMSATNRIRGIQELELQLAGRLDDYAVEGTPSFIDLRAPTPIGRVENKDRSTNPMVGLRYQPVRDVILRASFATGFVPPPASALFPTSPATTTGGAIDPLRNEPLGTHQRFSGGNPNIGPETSESWSLGAILTPRFAPGLRLSVDFVQIKKDDNIRSLSIQQTLDNESALPGRVIRGPVPGLSCTPVCPVTAIDVSQVNVSRSVLEAYDIQLDYVIETASLGTFGLHALATRQTHFKTQIAPSLPLLELVGLDGGINPLKFSGNAGLEWTRGPWMLGWTARYYDSYRLTAPIAVANQGRGGWVSSQIYHDFVGSYRFAASVSKANVLADTEVQLGIRNVFNAEPPFDADNSAGGDLFYSAIGDPRLATYYLSLKKQF